jgi:hypothetical protein
MKTSTLILQQRLQFLFIESSLDHNLDVFVA